MILTCPECSTRYLTKENAIGPNGRTVRCAKCDTTWFVASEADTLTLQDNQSPVEEIVQATTEDMAGEFGKNRVPEAPGAHVVMRDKVDKERRRRRLTSVGLIWAVPLFLLFVASILGYVFRQNIVNGVPQMATLYKTLGVDVTMSGLNIEDPITRSALIDGKPVLVVNGAVKNITSKDQDVPMVELSLHSKDGEPLVTWLVDVNTPRLAKNERVTFVSEYPNPPVDAVKLRYRFADETATAAMSGGSAQNLTGAQ
ncbi:MJ0042-type zinc finger domain-containing protein [Hellea balneolensis]|uniref:MJ0042-type zinc finger domain-containing protein n=1 Tax=Hellea balneolensis TaxID=287478 RepID=UPI0004133E34|nr:MJ0042-type zinc finger domain-containing protein [Hellea balneolensis]